MDRDFIDFHKLVVIHDILGAVLLGGLTRIFRIFLTHFGRRISHDAGHRLDKLHPVLVGSQPEEHACGTAHQEGQVLVLSFDEALEHW